MKCIIKSFFLQSNQICTLWQAGSTFVNHFKNISFVLVRSKRANKKDL